MATAKKPRTVRRPVKSGTPPEVRRAAEELVELKAQKKLIEESIDAANGVLLAHMSKANPKLSLAVGNFTWIQGETVVTDPEKLKKIIGAPTYNKITTQVLDKNKLDAFIKSGEIDTKSVAAASEVRLSKAYIKVTAK